MRANQAKTEGVDEAPVILYDGWCNLCDSTVGFVLRRDREGVFRFAPLQSPAATRLLANASGTAGEDTIVVVDGGLRRTRSEAVLAIVGRLPPPWRWLGVFRLIPRGWRDWAYDQVARRRRRWFGRPAACMSRLEGFEDRFLTIGE